MITDRFNRIHNYLRISLTDNCNLRCFYCMPDEEYEFSPASRLMQPDEIETIAKLFVEHGVKRIRLTGGEPLVRKDAANIILRLSKLPVDLTLTTNATRVAQHIDTLTDAGIKTINVSLDTLQAEKFNLITRRDQFQIVMDNIALLQSKNIRVKINCVVMKGLNDDEILDFIAWTKDNPVEVRFIEFMPFTGNRWTSNKVMTSKEILELVAGSYEVTGANNDIHDTARKYLVNGHAGTFAIISTMSEPFCEGCNRIRLTADGKLKNCLFSKSETDLLTALRNGQQLEPLITQNILSKEKELGGQFNNLFENLHPEDIENRSMITIGG
ncbi:MAG: GTP 3',8-cyclase MoaA [Chitinophagaceae bacterium]|nr:MAG: GTP 3',8-cyclase MoaA [Chitinophagaceae bacterium]